MNAEVLVRTLVGIASLSAMTVAVLRLFDVRPRWAPARAIARGAVQLAAISLVLAGLITHPALVGVALLVMFTVASLTSAGRVGWGWRRYAVVASAMGAGITVALVVVFATGAIEFSGRYLLATGGIVVGNAMTVATLTGRHLREATIAQWDEVEGWFALGATPRQATSAIARTSVASALVPVTDQTRTTGVVTLPGAFVGAIFGGVSPLEAGRFQIVVLAAVLACGAITSVVTARLLAPVSRKPRAL